MEQYSNPGHIVWFQSLVFLTKRLNEKLDKHQKTNFYKYVGGGDDNDNSVLLVTSFNLQHFYRCDSGPLASICLFTNKIKKTKQKPTISINTENETKQIVYIKFMSVYLDMYMLEKLFSLFYKMCFIM